MPESYTGDEGDDALAAGLAVMDGTEKWWNGWLAINKTRDMIVNWVMSLFPLSVARGGTASSSASDARTALGITPASIQAIGNDGAYYTRLSWNGTRYQADVPGYAFPAELAFLSDVGGGSYVSKTGDTMSGDLFIPGASGASFSWTVGYVNGDGRISRGTSSERYKHDIEPVTPSSLGDLFPQLHTFVVNGDPGEMQRVGYIAERLNESDDLRRFVVYARDVVKDDEGKVVSSSLARDEEGQPVPESIDFIALLIAQNAQLHETVRALTERVDAIAPQIGD